MDEQRALLDQLMGMNRDGDKPQEEITDFLDARVCKNFLCGLCPQDLFQNTKMDMGECELAHVPEVKQAYDEERKKKDFGYERDLMRILQRYASDVEKKIARAQKRLEEEEGSAVTPKEDPATSKYGGVPPSESIENNKEILQITAEIQDAVEKAEEAGNEGEVDLSMELMEKAEQLKQKKASLQASLMLANPVRAPVDESAPAVAAHSKVNQKLRVCDVCGAFLSVFDSDRRLADHFGGKLHLGYMQIQKKLKELKELLGDPNKGSDPNRSTRDSRSSRRSRSRSRDRYGSGRSPSHRREEGLRNRGSRDRGYDDRRGGFDRRDRNNEVTRSSDQRDQRERRDRPGRDRRYERRRSRSRSRSRSRERSRR